MGWKRVSGDTAGLSGDDSKDWTMGVDEVLVSSGFRLIIAGDPIDVDFSRLFSSNSKITGHCGDSRL